MKHFDFIIIGFGKAGKTLAAELASHGQQVAVIERSEKMYGGTCPNIACIPTKFLVHEASVSDTLYHGDFDKQSARYKSAIGRKNELTAMLRGNFYNKLASNPNVTVFTGEGSFVSKDTVRVALPEESIEINAERIFINTGSTPVIPPIKGVNDSRRVYVSTTLLELETLPRHLVIVGGGYIGLEFASMYATFGSKVTVLEGAGKFMPREDRDIAQAIRDVLERKGIDFRLNALAQSVSDSSEETTLAYKDSSDGSMHEVEGDAILLATGRKPMTEGLNIDAAGIETDERGAIRVNEKFQTNVPNIWALGDVKGGLQFTYVSLDDYRIVREQLFGHGNRTVNDRTPVQYAVFIDPPMSHVGVTEEEAASKGLDFKTVKLPAKAIARARTLNQTDGLLKAVVDAKTDKILGCTMFCANSSEMINIVAMAIRTGQDFTFLRDFMFTHPSMDEALNDLFDVK
jgi:pyruvate/2-oxoglutarate dehydrogenase complex dihydrolipoamide dehydrogenase (E3) component